MICTIRIKSFYNVIFYFVNICLTARRDTIYGTLFQPFVNSTFALISSIFGWAIRPNDSLERSIRISQTNLCTSKCKRYNSHCRKKAIYNPNYNPKVEFIIKINEYLYKNAKKNTTLCVNFCIKVVFWWAEVDSNHRSRRRQIYSLIHLATLESARIECSWHIVEPVIGLEPTTC